MDLSLVPDYIEALGRDGQPVGYVTREDALGLGPQITDNTGRPVDVPITVYAGDLATVVGHMVPGRGFVPLGADPKSIPEYDVKTGPAKPASP